MKIYSYSKLNTFEQCPLKFKLRYIDKIPPKIEKTIEAHLGACVHSSLEWLYKKIKEEKIPSLDELIIFYLKRWKMDFSPEIVVLNENLTTQDYLNKGVGFLSTYYLENKPFDDNTLEIEKKIMLDLDQQDQYKILGFIDRLTYNPKTQEYEIHDYKTSNNLPHKEKIENDKQLALYCLAIKDIFGHDKKVKLIWHYLAHNKKISRKKTNPELEVIKNQTLELIKQIEDTSEFLANKTKLCNWCEYKDICPK